MKSILISGAGGKLGRKLSERLSYLGYSQILLTSDISNQSLPFAEYVNADWSNLILPVLDQVDVVIHLAHQTSAYVAQQNVEADVLTNLVSTIRIVEAIQKSAQPPHFIYMGSLTQYGSNVENPINEELQKEDVETFYDCSKQATELYLRQYQREGILGKLTLIRLGNLYGFVDRHQTPHRGFFDNSIYRGFQGQSLTCFGDGNYLRDFVHINDVITALVEIIETKNSKVDGKFNLASGVGHTVKDALSLIVSTLNSMDRKRVSIEYQEFPVNSYAIERRNHVADISRLQEAISWRPTISLSDGISRSIKYYQDYEETTSQDE